MMPDEGENPLDSIRNGNQMSFRSNKQNTIHDLVPPFILKTRQLNLKLKFKNSSRRKKGKGNAATKMEYIA